MAHTCTICGQPYYGMFTTVGWMSGACHGGLTHSEYAARTAEERFGPDLLGMPDIEEVIELTKQVIAVRLLHAPQFNAGSTDCYGCDYGSDYGYPTWPCETAQIVYSTIEIAGAEVRQAGDDAKHLAELREYSAVEQRKRNLAAGEQATLHAEEYARLSPAERRAAAVAFSVDLEARLADERTE